MIRTAQQFDVRMPANDARCRARRVQKNAIEGIAVPPLCRLSGIAADHVCLQLQSLQILLHTLKPACIVVQSKHSSERETAFKQMAGFASWRCTGIKDGEAGLQLQESGNQLRSFVLYADKPVLKPGKGRHGTRSVKVDARCAELASARSDASLLQGAQICLA